jgi:hypothetical protein
VAGYWMKGVGAYGQGRVNARTAGPLSRDPGGHDYQFENSETLR